MTRNGARLAALLAGLLVAITLGMSVASAQRQTVRVRLTEWTVTADPSSIQQGETAFTAENAGAAPHNLVVIKTDLAPGALPVTGEARIDRSHLDVVAETEAFPGGQTRSVVSTLSPGHYVLVCDLPGHYQSGMRTGFTITAAPPVEPTSTAGLQSTPGLQPTPAATSGNSLPVTGTGPVSQQGVPLWLPAGLLILAAIAAAGGAAIWRRQA